MQRLLLRFQGSKVLRFESGGLPSPVWGHSGAAQGEFLRRRRERPWLASFPAYCFDVDGETVLIMLLWWMEQRALSFLLGGLVVFSLSLFLEAQVFNLRLYLGPLKLPCLSQERRGET